MPTADGSLPGLTWTYLEQVGLARPTGLLPQTKYLMLTGQLICTFMGIVGEAYYCIVAIRSYIHFMTVENERKRNRRN